MRWGRPAGRQAGLISIRVWLNFFGSVACSKIYVAGWLVGWLVGQLDRYAFKLLDDPLPNTRYNRFDCTLQSVRLFFVVEMIGQSEGGIFYNRFDCAIL